MLKKKDERNFTLPTEKSNVLGSRISLRMSSLGANEGPGKRNFLADCSNVAKTFPSKSGTNIVSIFTFNNGLNNGNIN